MTQYGPGPLARVAMCLLLLLAGAVQAARADGWSGSRTLTIDVAGPSAYRVFTLDDPMRVVIDIAGHQWPSGGRETYARSDVVADARVGMFAPGWARLVLELSRPLALESSTLDPTSDGHALTFRFRDSDHASFAASRNTDAEASLLRRQPAAGSAEPSLVIALDPGHGGIDPGAIRGVHQEKSLTLDVALRLRELIRSRSGIDVVLTRDSDAFVALADRVAIARGAGADVFVSIHADTVEQGRIEGASVYTLSETASDSTAAALASFENDADLAAGLEPSGNNDDVALFLSDMARTETNARSLRLGEALVRVLRERVGVIATRPHRTAGLRVLRAPDIPSVLIELGSLSNPEDRARILSPAWQDRAAQAVLDGILAWARSDNRLSGLDLN